MKKQIAIALLIMAVLVWVLCFTGCSWSAYNRETWHQDPDTLEWVIAEEIHAGRLALATDIDLSKLSIKSGDKELALDGMKEEQDSIEGLTPYGPFKTKGE